jgi:hypothetical protein
MGEVKLSLHDLIVEIHELDRKLQALEEKYSLLSVDFYQLYEDGRLRDDELDEIDELGRWAAWYRMRTRRVAQYDLSKNAFLTNGAQTKSIILKPHQAFEVA